MQTHMETGSPSNAAPQGHDEAMADKFDAANAVAAETPPVEPEHQDRPEWLPEKFQSPEDMAKAYSDLERRMSGQQQQQQPDEAGTEAPEEFPDSLNWQAFNDEYSELGGLSDAAYEALHEHGIPREMVDAYISGQEAQAEQLRSQMTAAVGGDEAYDTMSDWARGHMDQNEINAYNRAIDSGDPEIIQMAVQGLQAKYIAANGKEPRLVEGQGPANANAFESWSQVKTAMKDPRYRDDPAYRASVERKLAASSL